MVRYYQLGFYSLMFVATSMAQYPTFFEFFKSVQKEDQKDNKLQYGSLGFAGECLIRLRTFLQKREREVPQKKSWMHILRGYLWKSRQGLTRDFVFYRENPTIAMDFHFVLIAMGYQWLEDEWKLWIKEREAYMLKQKELVAAAEKCITIDLVTLKKNNTARKHWIQEVVLVYDAWLPLDDLESGLVCCRHFHNSDYRHTSDELRSWLYTFDQLEEKKKERVILSIEASIANEISIENTIQRAIDMAMLDSYRYWRTEEEECWRKRQEIAGDRLAVLCKEVFGEDSRAYRKVYERVGIWEAKTIKPVITKKEKTVL